MTIILENTNNYVIKKYIVFNVSRKKCNESLFTMHVSIHVGCVRKILLAPFCAALHMDDFCLFCLVVVHKAWTTSTLLPRCAPIDWHESMKYGLLLNTSIAKLSICIWTTKAFCPSIVERNSKNSAKKKKKKKKKIDCTLTYPFFDF